MAVGISVNVPQSCHCLPSRPTVSSSPACADIPVLLAESGELYYPENSWSLCCLKNASAQSVLSSVEACLYILSCSLWVPLRHLLPAAFPALLCRALPSLLSSLQTGPDRVPPFCTKAHGTHTSMNEMPLTPEFTLGAVKFDSKGAAWWCSG